MSTARVIGNPAAPGGLERLHRVAGMLAEHGCDARVIDAPSVGEAADAAADAVRGGIERLVAVGGDGVVHLAVNAVACSPTVLGIVADGTGNDVARALGLLDGDLPAQVERAAGDGAPVDAIRTDHGWVASVATLGFSGDVTARAERLRRPRGPARYTVATLLQLPRLRTVPVAIEVDGVEVAASTTLLAIGNTAYFGGGMRICPDARPDDGTVQVVSIGAVPRHRFLRVFPTVFSGRHVRRPEVVTSAGTHVRLSGTADELWADGERLGPLPVSLEIVPGALRVAGFRPSESA